MSMGEVSSAFILEIYFLLLDVQLYYVSWILWNRRDYIFFAHRRTGLQLRA